MDEYLTEVAEDIASKRGIPIEDALRIVAAARPLWGALEPLVDGYGGSEFCRIFPEVVEAIHRLANPLAYELT